MLKILQARLQQCVNPELPDVQAKFRKGRETRDQIANICWIMEKARESQKNIYFCFTDYTKAFVWITTNCRKFLKRWEYQTTLPVSWETCMPINKQWLKMYREQLTVQKFGKKYDKAVYCHPACLTYMQNVCVCQSLSHVWFFTTPWAVVRQASLSMEFSRQEYWNGLPFSSPGDCHNPGSEPGSPELQADSLPSEPAGKPYMQNTSCKMLGWMNHKLESRLWGEISTTSNTQLILL